MCPFLYPAWCPYLFSGVDWENFYVHIVKQSKRSRGCNCWLCTPSADIPFVANLCTKRLQAIFATCLLRRRKDSKLDGKNLIELPPKYVDLVKLDFSPEEQAIYQAVYTVLIPSCCLIILIPASRWNPEVKWSSITTSGRELS